MNSCGLLESCLCACLQPGSKCCIRSKRAGEGCLFDFPNSRKRHGPPGVLFPHSRLVLGPQLVLDWKFLIPPVLAFEASPDLGMIVLPDMISMAMPMTTNCLHKWQAFNNYAVFWHQGGCHNAPKMHHICRAGLPAGHCSPQMVQLLHLHISFASQEHGLPKKHL